MSFKDRFGRFRRVFVSTFLNQCLIFGSQFLSSVLIVKALDIHAYATYVLFNTTLNLASNLTNLGLRSYLVRFLPGSDPARARRILWAVLAGQFLAGALLLCAYAPALFRPGWGWTGSIPRDNFRFLYACFGCVLMLSFAPRQFAGFFRFLDEDHRRANRVQIIAGTAFPVFLIASALILGKLTLGYVLIGMAAMQAFSMALIIPFSSDMAGYPGTAAVASELRAAVRYSWPFAFLPVATQLIELGNRYFLAGYGSAVDLAQFSFNYGICSAGFQLITTSMGFTYFPAALRLFNQGKRHEAENLNFKGVLACTAMVVVFFAAFRAASPPFFHVLGKEKLHLGLLPYALICCSFVAQVLGQQGNFLLQAYNLRVSNMGLTLTGTVISLGMNFLLIPRYQVTGAALALAVTALALLTLNWIPILAWRAKGRSRR